MSHPHCSQLQWEEEKYKSSDWKAIGHKSLEMDLKLAKCVVNCDLSLSFVESAIFEAVLPKEYNPPCHRKGK